MNSISDIKQHLNSVTQTRQITNAMYLLSTSRLKKALLNVDYNFQYMKSLRNTMNDILYVTKGAGIHNCFLDKDSRGTALFLSVMGDKGLCGDYNSAVAAFTMEKLRLKSEPLLYCFGRVGKEKLEAHGLTPDKVLSGSAMNPSMTLARELTSQLLELYVSDRVNEVYIIFTPYRRDKREPVCMRLLPLLRHDFNDIKEDAEVPTELLYEPSAQEVFKHLVPLYCAGMIYDILMQSAASENAARMEAMQSAVSNADEMIKKLHSELNAVRQLSITNEITEIAAAADIQGAV